MSEVTVREVAGMKLAFPTPSPEVRDGMGVTVVAGCGQKIFGRDVKGGDIAFLSQEAEVVGMVSFDKDGLATHFNGVDIQGEKKPLSRSLRHRGREIRVVVIA